MESIIISLAVFFACFCCHVFLHRCIRNKMKGFFPLIVYLIVFPLLIIVFLQRKGGFPMTAVTLFILLSIVMLILYVGPVVDYGPSTHILELFRKKPVRSISEIQRHFSEHALIDERIAQLHRVGFLFKQGRAWKATRKGILIGMPFLFYIKLFHRKNTG